MKWSKPPRKRDRRGEVERLRLRFARLAVHGKAQGCGLGAGLLLDALGRMLQVAGLVGIRALAVHAKDEQAAAFYRHFCFTSSPTDPRHLFMLINDIRAAAQQKS